MTTPKPTPFPDGLQRLIREARHLRDHALRASDLDAIELTQALFPFERESDFTQIPDADVHALNVAFQKTYDQARLVIEERTLNFVLAGRSPLLSAPNLPSKVAVMCNNAVLTFLAILLVLGAFHYSSWISNSSRAISDSKLFLAFDNTAKINRLIELQKIFEDSDSDDDPISSPILQTYLEEAADLEEQYFTEVELPSRLRKLNANVNPIHPIMNRFLTHTCDIDGAGFSFIQRVIFGCLPPRPLPSPNSRLTTDPLLIGPQANKDNDFELAIESVEGSRREIMRSFGRTPETSYRQTRYLVGTRMQELEDRLSLIYLWALPVIYGALGSAVYSMWCMLSSNVCNHRFSYFSVRMIFGGLAALTFSMLLVPSNIFVVGADLNRPLVYLMAFIFGYSIETFINVLNQINRYVADSISFKKNKPPPE